ncbi:MAG: PAS domain-containing protein, partial [Smithella sp.]
KEADEALQRGRTLLQSLIDNTPALIYAIDTKGKIIIANKAFGDLLGRKPSEIMGRRRHEFLPGDIAGRDEANDREVLSVGHSLEFEERGTFNDEETIFLTTKAPLQDQDGNIWGVTVISTDITERKRADETLKKKSADLIAVNRELESFAYSISHDLRAPLRAIDGFSRIILKKYSAGFNEDVIAKFNVIRSNAQIMGQLIDDILSLSRLSREKMSLAPLEMTDIINNVWNELMAINPERKMELIIKEMPPAFGDRTLLKQVYANLLGNAVKFTRKRDIALIEAGGYRKGNENVYYVKDNGAGFNMEYQDKLFGVFQRLHPASEFEGTGIGLSIVSRIISRHGGSVWAEGKEDEGAVFFFTIPFRNQETTRPRDL